MLSPRPRLIEPPREARLRTWLLSAEAADFVKVVMTKADMLRAEIANSLREAKFTEGQVKRLREIDRLQTCLDVLGEFQRQPDDEAFLVMDVVGITNDHITNA